MPEFPSEEWLVQYVDRINGSPEYKEAAATWEGDISYVFEAEPDKGVPQELWAYLDLWHGTCRGGGVVDPAMGERAAFLLSAPYSRWKAILLGELDPIKGMMQGKLKVRGDLPTIVRYVRAANELVRLTGEVDTVFPDEG